jgi:uncharacterized protein YgiM (DUF1202 family)
MAQLGRLLRPLLYLSVILGSALTFTTSANVYFGVLQSVGAGPGGPPPVRALTPIRVPDPPAGKVPVPAMPLPAPQTASIAAPAAVPQADQASPAPPADLFVVTSGVNVRAGASKDAERLSTLETGTEVTIVTRDGHWAQVARGEAVLGWVYDRYLEAAN